MAMIQQVGVAARKGGARARAAYAAIKKYIETHPVKTAAQSFFGADNGTAVSKLSTRPDPEMKKPVLPAGLLDGLFDPERFEVCILRACKFRHGLAAAAVVLATSDPLTIDAIKGIGESMFGGEDDESKAHAACFLHGVKFCGEKDWQELAPRLDPPLRRALVVGQCVGRARQLQMARHPNSSISRYAPVAGWELGE